MIYKCTIIYLVFILVILQLLLQKQFLKHVTACVGATRVRVTLWHWSIDSINKINPAG